MLADGFRLTVLFIHGSAGPPKRVGKSLRDYWNEIFYRPDALPAVQPTASKYCSGKCRVFCEQNVLIDWFMW